MFQGMSRIAEALGADTTKPRTSLAQRLLVLFVLFSLGPFFATNLWGYFQSEEYLTENAFRHVRNVAALEASQTLVFAVAKRDTVPLIVAGDPQLVSLVRELDAETDAARLEHQRWALTRRLVEKANENDDVHELLVLSPQGRVLGSTRDDRSFREDLAADRCFTGRQRGPRIIGFEHVGWQPVLVVAAPVADALGTQWGVFCARFAFDPHQESRVREEFEATEVALTFLDGGGHVVGVVGRGSEHAPIGTLLERPRPMVAGAAPWEARLQNGASEETISAFAPIPDIEGGVLAEVQVSTALANLTRLKWQGIGGGTLLSLVLVFGASMAARGMTGPLERLSGAARRVATGKLGERVATDGPREVADLADTFNGMSRALEDSRSLLEQRIAEATKELRQTQEFTEHLLNSIDQRVVVIDSGLRVFKANHVALSAYGEPLLGRRCDEIFENGLTVSDAGPVRHTFETEERCTTERAEGQEIVRLDTLPITSSIGSVEAVIVVGRVVTGDKRIQAELLHHEKMAAFGLLAAGVAHEIGNPLASIAAQLRMNREVTEPERVKRTFGIVEREVNRVAGLLRELVMFARRKRDELTLVQVNEVVEDVSRLLVHNPGAQNVRIEKRLGAGLPGVFAKEDHLVQVLLNLGLNALDAMAGSGTLVLETSFDEHFVTCRVRDTGPGIPGDVLPRLFEAFFTTKDAGRGTGLGLFVSKDIVDRLGGKLEIERTTTEGTVFAVKLPIRTAAPAVAVRFISSNN